MTNQRQLFVEGTYGNRNPKLAPVKAFIPFCLGSVRDADQIVVLNEFGQQTRVQRQVLGRWPDQTVRYCQLEFDWEKGAHYFVAIDDNGATDAGTKATSPRVALPIDQQTEPMPLSKCDQLQFNAAKASIAPVLTMRLRHDDIDYHAQFRLTDDRCDGPVRWSRSWNLQFETVNGQASSLVGELTANVYSSISIVDFECVVRNPNAAAHLQGNWDLGADGSIVIQDLSVGFATGMQPDGLSIKLGRQEERIDADRRIHLFQASSGGENWDSSNHVDRNGRVSLAFRGYEVEADGNPAHSGHRAEPMIESYGSSTVCSVACSDFWQNFPKTLSADRDELRLGLFPAEAVGGTELQGGEQKTHRFALELRSPETPSQLDHFLNPPLIRLASTDDSHAAALPYLIPRSETSDAKYEALVNLAIEGEDTCDAKSGLIDQFGWRNFGDLYGDHEAAFHRGDSPMISHYNNQYDCTLGFAIQFLRSGDRRWYDLMTRMADHAWDIDTYHTDQDKLLYNGGLFWHTYHYADADTATHRSYPKRLRTFQSFDGGQDLSQLGDTGDQLAKNYAIGGGPAAAHNYSTGWMVAYHLTGCDRYRTAAIQAADYVMRIDDGRKTPFRWLSHSDTGYSTCSSDGYYGPGRASGNSIAALLTGHELTGDDKYLDRAAKLMRRTAHPHDDLESLDLLNAELRWFYTMHLQSLSRFVDYKDSLGERDDDFCYGVGTLLHYANWMAINERPTLSEPEKLQYPTETWAAQDIRKWHVLQHAAQYECDPSKRKQMQRKAEFFYRYVVDTLTDSPTKSLCRPLVIMLNFGWQRDWFLANQDKVRLTQPVKADFGFATKFQPQRQIAIARFKKILGATIILLFASIIGLGIWAFQ